MANNLVDQLKSQVSAQAIEQVASKVGISSDKTKSAVDAGIPAIVDSLGQRAKDPQGAAALLGVFQNQGDAAGAANMADAGIMDKGKAMLGSLLGPKQAEVEEKVSAAAGIQKDEASGVMGMITPMVTNFITTKLKSEGGGMNIAALAPLLGGGGGAGDMLGDVAGGLLGGKKDGDDKGGGIAGAVGGLFGKK